MKNNGASLFIDICIEILEIFKKSVETLDVRFIKDIGVLKPICEEFMISTRNYELSEEVLFKLISAIELIYNDRFISKYKYKKIIGMINEFNKIIN